MSAYLYTAFEYCKSSLNGVISWCQKSLYTNIEYIPNYIRREVSSYEKWKNVNLSDLKGDTGYIDFINKNFFPEGYNVIFGRDRYNRFYISALYSSLDNINNYQVMTIFERYTNSNHLIVSAGSRFMENFVAAWNRRYNSMDPQIRDFLTMIGDNIIDVKYSDIRTDERLSKKYKLFDNRIVKVENRILDDIELDDLMDVIP